MSKKSLLIGALFTISGAVLFSCGGGGSSSSSTTSGGTTTTTVTGTVQSSIVKGATVCVNGTNTCAVSDDNGTFNLTVQGQLPVTLEVKAAGVPIAYITANSTYVPVNPVTLTDGNLTLAPMVKAFIHALGGDFNGTAQLVDLSNATPVEVNVTEPVVQLLEKKRTVSVKVKVHDKDVVVNITPTVVIANNQTVNATVDNLNLQLWAFEQFLAQSDGKTVTFVDANGNKVATCKLDAEAPNLVKLEDCSNPDWNSDGWATVTIDNATGKVAIKTPDGQYYDLVSLDPINGVVCYDDNGQQYCAYVSSGNATEDQEKVEYAQLISFLDAQNGKIVNIQDTNGDSATCTFVVNPAANNQFALVNCSPWDFNSDGWTKVEDEKTQEGWKLEGDTYGYITSVDTNTKTLQAQVWDGDLQKWVYATLTFTDQNGTIIYPGPVNNLTKFGIYGRVNYNGVIPPEWKIRITPANEQINGNWGGVVCQIFPDGSFGQLCEVHGNIDDFTQNTTYQIIVFNDTNYNWRFDTNETAIYGVENATFGAWTNIYIGSSTGNYTVYNNTTVNNTIYNNTVVNNTVYNSTTVSNTTASNTTIANATIYNTTVANGTLPVIRTLLPYPSDPGVVDIALESLNGTEVKIEPLNVVCTLNYDGWNIRFNNCTDPNLDNVTLSEFQDSNATAVYFNSTEEIWQVIYADNNTVCALSLTYGDVNCLVKPSAEPTSINSTLVNGTWELSDDTFTSWIGNATLNNGTITLDNGTFVANYTIVGPTLVFYNTAPNIQTDNVTFVYGVTPNEWIIRGTYGNGTSYLQLIQKISP